MWAFIGILAFSLSERKIICSQFRGQQKTDKNLTSKQIAPAAMLQIEVREVMSGIRHFGKPVLHNKQLQNLSNSNSKHLFSSSV